MNKHENAIADYEKARLLIKKLTNAISDASLWIDERTGDSGSTCTNIRSGDTCIQRYWSENLEARHIYDCTGEHMEREETELCPSCQLIDKLVVERKKAKRDFGIAKRRISQMGKALIR